MPVAIMLSEYLLCRLCMIFPDNSYDLLSFALFLRQLHEDPLSTSHIWHQVIDLERKQLCLRVLGVKLRVKKLSSQVVTGRKSKTAHLPTFPAQDIHV